MPLDFASTKEMFFYGLKVVVVTDIRTAQLLGVSRDLPSDQWGYLRVAAGETGFVLEVSFETTARRWVNVEFESGVRYWLDPDLILPALSVSGGGVKRLDPPDNTGIIWINKR